MSYRLYHITLDRYYLNPFEKTTTYRFDSLKQVSLYKKNIIAIHNDYAVPADQAHAKWIDEEFVIITDREIYNVE